MTARPAIPAAVKLALRREAWFGCCKCGGPFFEYHHILGVNRTGHIAEDMMLLCPMCHHLATVGALDEIQQRRLKAFPHNKLKGYAHGQLWTKRDVLLIDIGTNVLAGPGYKLMVDDKLLLSIRHGNSQELLISLAAYDSRNELALLVEDNEWLVGADSLTDLVAKPLWVKVSSPYLPHPLTIDARDPFLIIRGCIEYAGRGWDIEDNKLSASGYQFAGVGFFDCGFHFKSDGAAFTLGSIDDPEHGRGTFTGLSGASTRKEWAAKVLAAYRKWKAGLTSVGDEDTIT